MQLINDLLVFGNTLQQEIGILSPGMDSSGKARSKGLENLRSIVGIKGIWHIICIRCLSLDILLYRKKV